MYGFIGEWLYQNDSNCFSFVLFFTKMISYVYTLMKKINHPIGNKSSCVADDIRHSRMVGSYWQTLVYTLIAVVPVCVCMCVRELLIGFLSDQVQFWQDDSYGIQNGSYLSEMNHLPRSRSPEVIEVFSLYIHM